MKVTKFLVFSFLLFAFTATSFPDAVHAKDHDAVIDSSGDEVRAGNLYFITTPSSDNATTLAVTATGRVICGSDVVVRPLTDKLPITFSPVAKSNDSFIREDTYLNLNFYAPICFRSDVTAMWKIAFRPTVRGFIVTTGGVDRFNRFKITKYGVDKRLYQLSYCPMAEPICECSCIPLGNVFTNLAPSANPLPVVFGFHKKPQIEYKMVEE